MSKMRIVLGVFCVLLLLSGSSFAGWTPLPCDSSYAGCSGSGGVAIGVAARNGSLSLDLASHDKITKVDYVEITRMSDGVVLFRDDFNYAAGTDIWAASPSEWLPPVAGSAVADGNGFVDVTNDWDGSAPGGPWTTILNRPQGFGTNPISLTDAAMNNGGYRVEYSFIAPTGGHPEQIHIGFGNPFDDIYIQDGGEIRIQHAVGPQTGIFMPKDGTSLFGLRFTRYNDAGVSLIDYEYIPEPATMSLLLLGTGVAALRRRRRS